MSLRNTVFGTISPLIWLRGQEGKWLVLRGDTTTGAFLEERVFVSQFSLQYRSKSSRESFIHRRIKHMGALLMQREAALRVLPQYAESLQ